VQSASAGGSGLALQPIAGTLTAQTITVTLNATDVQNGSTSDKFNFDIESNGTITGLKLYDVSSGATTTDYYSPNRGKSISYTAVKNGDNSVELTLLKLDYTTVHSKLVLEIDPATVKINGGVGGLDTDGDKKPGEAGEDLYVKYINVSQGTETIPSNIIFSLTGREPPNPQDTVTAGNISSSLSTDWSKNTGTTITFSGFQDVASSATNFSGTTLAAAYTFEKWSGSGWTKFSPTASYASTGTLSFTLATPSVTYDFYRYRVDQYKIVEAAAVGGYIHRADYDQSAVPAAWSYTSLVNGTTITDQVFLPTASASLDGVDGKFYIDVTVSVNGAASLPQVKEASLTPSHVQVFHYLGTDTMTIENNKGSAVERLVFSKRSDTQFRINLPADFAKYASNGSLQVRLYDVEVGYTAAAYTIKESKFRDATSDGSYRVDITY
jgi:hypothetical protein